MRRFPRQRLKAVLDSKDANSQSKIIRLIFNEHATGNLRVRHRLYCHTHGTSVYDLDDTAAQVQFASAHLLPSARLPRPVDQKLGNDVR